MLNKLDCKREGNVWVVTGNGVDAVVYGTVRYGPNGAISGKGAKKFRTEILAAVQAFRKQSK